MPGYVTAKCFRCRFRGRLLGPNSSKETKPRYTWPGSSCSILHIVGARQASFSLTPERALRPGRVLSDLRSRSEYLRRPGQWHSEEGAAKPDGFLPGKFTRYVLDHIDPWTLSCRKPIQEMQLCCLCPGGHRVSPGSLRPFGLGTSSHVFGKVHRV